MKSLFLDIKAALVPDGAGVTSLAPFWVMAVREGESGGRRAVTLVTSPTLTSTSFSQVEQPSFSILRW